MANKPPSPKTQFALVVGPWNFVGHWALVIRPARVPIFSNEQSRVDLSPHSEQASLGLFHSLWCSGKTNAAFNEMRRFVKSNDSPHYRQLIRDMLAEAPSKAISLKEPLVVA
jgi:hypothetical protein